jgi:hypothetical protein
MTASSIGGATPRVQQAGSALPDPDSPKGPGARRHRIGLWTGAMAQAWIDGKSCKRR